MPTPWLQSVFSPAIGNVVQMLGTGIIAAIPGAAEFAWLPTLFGLAWPLVSEIDAADDLAGTEKMVAVKDAIVSRLDAIDVGPGWSELTEEIRDDLIAFVAETVVFALRAKQVGGLPDQHYRESFADGLKSGSLAIMEIISLVTNEGGHVPEGGPDVVRRMASQLKASDGEKIREELLRRARRRVTVPRAKPRV